VTCDPNPNSPLKFKESQGEFLKNFKNFDQRSLTLFLLLNLTFCTSLAVISSNNKPLLFPCGNLRKETIPLEMEKAGIIIYILM